MALTVMKCPSCGGDLNLNIDQDHFFCPFCGAKISTVDKKIIIEHVNRIVNEAELEKIRLEKEKKSKEDEEDLPRVKRAGIAFLICLIAGLIFRNLGDRMLSLAGLLLLFCAAMLFLCFGFGFLIFGFKNNKNRNK